MWERIVAARIQKNKEQTKLLFQKAEVSNCHDSDSPGLGVTTGAMAHLWSRESEFSIIVSKRYKAGKKVAQTSFGSRSKLSSQSATKGDIMEKTKSKAKRFLKLDRLGLRIAHAQKYLAKQRKERAERSYERSMLQAT